MTAEEMLKQAAAAAELASRNIPPMHTPKSGMPTW